MTISAQTSGPGRTTRFTEAIADFEEALSLIDAEGQPGFYGVVLHDIADVYKAMGEQEKAAASYRDAIEHKQRADNPSDLATTMLVFGDLLIDSGELAEARSILDQTKELLGANSGELAPVRLAYRLHDLGRGYEDLGNRDQEGAYSEALDVYGQALSLIDAEGQPGFYGVVLHDIADVYKAMGEQEKAAASYRDAIEHKQRADKPSDLATTMLVFGDLLIDSGELAEARSILDQTKELLEEGAAGLKPAQRAVQVHDLGQAYQRLGEEDQDGAYAEAILAYQEACRLLDPTADPGSYATVVKHVGDVHQAQGRLTEALASYQDAVEHMRRHEGADSSVASLLVDLGRLRCRIGMLGGKMPPIGEDD